MLKNYEVELKSFKKCDEEDDRSESPLPIVPIFYAHPHGHADDLWRLTTTPRDREYHGDLSTNASSEDLYSIESGSQYTDTIRSLRSSYSSLASQESVAQWSAASTPQSSPVSTPLTKRKVKTSLKLSGDDSTWKKSRGKRASRRKRIKHQLQNQSTKVIAAVKKEKTQLRIKLVLVILFGCIVGIVAYTRDSYLEKRRQVVIGEKIKFDENNRKLYLLNKDGTTRIKGNLGVEIPNNVDSYHCGSSHTHFSSGVCLEWKYRARLMIQHIKHSNVSCYSVEWESLNSETILKDCIDMKDAYWYGAGELKTLSWPLSGTMHQSIPVVTGDFAKGGFGPVLERYWLSSKGIAIRVEPEDPLYVSINSTGNRNLCLEAKYAGFPYYALKDSLPKLRYNICTGPSIRTVHKRMVRIFQNLPNRTNDDILEFIEKPTWKPLSPDFSKTINQTFLKEYAHNISRFSDNGGFIIIDSSWQAKEGDMEFDVSSFPNADEIFTILRRKNFKYLLTVHPYSCLESRLFSYLAYEKHFVSDRFGQIPLLTRWQNKFCALLDLTKNISANFFLSRLEVLKERFKVSGFVFTGGLASHQPRRYKFNNYSANPDYFIRNYLNIASQISPVMGSHFGFSTQNILSFISLPPRKSSWDSVTGLKSIIPTVLMMGLLGYPIINPGSVGGELNSFDNGYSNVVDTNLYLRWMQLATFLPVIQFSILPDSYSSEIKQAVYNLLEIRRKVVVPSLKRALEEYFVTGAPIIRPLWWMAPDDHNAHSVDSEFIIGNDLLVAPVVEPGKIKRDIYVPPGEWRDENNEITIMGGKWMHSYIVQKNRVAYFIKKF